ncbi:hypothetical protein EI94DRAFT_1742117 [Lactarius quietus]|nr:hypothetical protein EI94DRAFT_1742117 [Lactarius quietus]
MRHPTLSPPPSSHARASPRRSGDPAVWVNIPIYVTLFTSVVRTRSFRFPSICLLFGMGPNVRYVSLRTVTVRRSMLFFSHTRA